MSNECECPDPGNSFEKPSPVHTEGTYYSICSWTPLCNQQIVPGVEWVMLFKYGMCLGVAVFLNDHTWISNSLWKVVHFEKPPYSLVLIIRKTLRTWLWAFYCSNSMGEKKSAIFWLCTKLICLLLWRLVASVLEKLLLVVWTALGGVAWRIQWIRLWLQVGSLLPLEQKTICEEFWLQLRSSALRSCPLSLLCKYWLVANLQFWSFTTQNGAWVVKKSAFPTAEAP